MTIFSVLNQIKSGEVVLPAIQRDFVWSADRVLTLLDSIMRGYPVGIALLWKTYENIQYRKFTDNFRSGDTQNFSENSQRHKLKIVLDGQQRLQSLYIALYGKLENEALYFDVLSGIDFDELSEDKYIFAFIDVEKVKSLNSHNEGKQKKAFIKGTSDQVLLFSALKVGVCFPEELPHPDNDIKDKCGLRVRVLRLWRPLSGLRRHYAPSGANCRASRLRCW